MMNRFLGGLFSLGFATNLAFAGTLVHDPLRSLLPGQPIDFSVSLQTLDDHNMLVVNYRAGDFGPYTSMIMTKISSDRFFVEIPNNILQGSSLQYYIELKKDGRVTETLPETDPGRFPFVAQSKDLGSATLSFFSPDTESSEQNDKTNVIIGVTDQDNVLNSDTARLLLDNNEVKWPSQISKTLWIYTPIGELSEGDHRLEINVSDINGLMYSKIQSFSVKHKPRNWLNYNGSASFSGEYDVSNSTYFRSLKNQFSGSVASNIHMDAFGINSELNFYADTLDNAKQQPINRYSIQLSNVARDFVVDQGYFFSSWTPLTLNGARVNGTQIYLDSLGWLGLKHLLTFRGISGVTKKAIPATDGMGTFKQTVKGAQLGLEIFGNKIQGTYVRFLDQLNSLSSAEANGRTGVQNDVLSIFASIELPDGGSASLEVAGSVYYSDITAGELPVSDLDLPISQSLAKRIFSYFPPRTSILLGGGSRFRISTPLIVRNVFFNGRADWVMPGFSSLGDYSTRKDYFGYGGDLKLGLFENHFVLNGGIDQSSDNLLKSSDYTNVTLDKRIGGSFFLNDLFMFNTMLSSSDLNNTEIHGAAVPDDRKSRSQYFTFYNGISGLSFQLMGIQQTMGFNFSQTTFSDYVHSDSNYKAWTIGTNISDNLAPFSLNLGGTLSRRGYDSGSKKVNWAQNLNLNLVYDWVPTVLQLNVGTSVNFDRTRSDRDSERAATRRLSVSSGIQYALPYLGFLNQSSFFADISYNILRDEINVFDAAQNYSYIIARFGCSGQF